MSGIGRGRAIGMMRNQKMWENSKGKSKVYTRGKRSELAERRRFCWMELVISMLGGLGRTWSCRSVGPR